METKVLTGRQLRVRWLLFRAPIVLVPLLTVIFKVLGGGPGDAAKGRVSSGFNMRLPGAQVAKLGRLDKLGYYQQAEKDSMEQRQRRAMESNYAKMVGLPTDRTAFAKASTSAESSAARSAVEGRGAVGGVDSNVRAVQAKLSELNRVLAASPVPVRPPGVVTSPSARQNPSMERLEKLMGVLRKTQVGQDADPQIAQLNGVLDKLAAVQRPVHGAFADSGRGQVAHRAVLGVRAMRDADDTSTNDSRIGIDTTAITAVVPDGQVLVSGGELRLELASDVEVGGQRIPRGTPVYGQVALGGERLRVSVVAICWQERVFPVNLAVDDEDGLAGIHIPGAPGADAMRESASQEVGSFGPEILSTTLAGQAAGAGVSLARSMIGKKVRMVRVTVPAGYRVILHVQNAGL